MGAVPITDYNRSETTGEYGIFHLDSMITNDAICT
jgi:hypothetical protein